MSAGPYRMVEIQEEPARPKASWWLVYIHDRDFPLTKLLATATLLLTPLDDEKTP